MLKYVLYLSLELNNACRDLVMYITIDNEDGRIHYTRTLIEYGKWLSTMLRDDNLIISFVPDGL